MPTPRRSVGTVAAIETATFWLYGGFAVAALVFVRVLVPETKDRLLEDVEQGLERKTGRRSRFRRAETSATATR